MTKTVAAVLAVSLLTGSASCGKRKKKRTTRWDAPVVEQTDQHTAYPVCWSDLSNLPCVVVQSDTRGVLHLSAVETGVVRTQDVLLVFKDGNGDWHVQPA